MAEIWDDGQPEQSSGVESCAQSGSWSYLDPSEAQEPRSYRVVDINGEPNHAMRIVKRILYAFELAGVIERVQRLRSMADELEKPTEENFPDIHPAIAEAKEKTTEETFSEEEATYDAFQQEIIDTFNEVNNYRKADFDGLLERTKVFSADNVPVLSALRQITKVHIHTYSKDDEYMTYMAERVARRMIDRQENPAATA